MERALTWLEGPHSCDLWEYTTAGNTQGQRASHLLLLHHSEPSAGRYLSSCHSKTADGFSIEKSLRGHRNKPGTRNQVSPPKWAPAALSRGTLPCLFPCSWVLTLSKTCTPESVLSSQVSLNLLTAETHQFESIWLRRDQPTKSFK